MARKPYRDTLAAGIVVRLAGEFMNGLVALAILFVLVSTAGRLNTPVPVTDPPAETTASVPSPVPSPSDAERVEVTPAPTVAFSPPFPVLPPPHSGMVLPPPGLAVVPVDLDRVRATIDAYRAGDVAKGDLLAQDIANPDARRTVEWVAIRWAARHMSFDRLAAFLRAEPGFAMADWIRRRAEDALFRDKRAPATVLAFFEGREPEMATGLAALAAAHLARGEEARAIQLARLAWRRQSLPRDVERWTTANVPGAVGRAEIVRRALAQVLTESEADGLRLAALAGPDDLALARLLAASVDGRVTAQQLAAAQPAVRNAPLFALVRSRHLRQSGNLEEAARTLLAASTAADDLIDGDAWFAERRMVARQLLDAGDAKTAYTIVSRHAAQSDVHRIDAEFYAGWIALRFLSDPRAAGRHFARAAGDAETPISVARVSYWQGRAAEAGAPGDPEAFYRRAARHPVAYYGQLAAAKLGHPELHIRSPGATAADHAMFAASPSGRAIRILLDAGFRELVGPMAVDLAQTATDVRQLDALGATLRGHGDARLLLTFGKAAVQRGLPFERHAFPNFGVPLHDPVEGSAEPAMVYAVVRQESAFQADAVSQANARGLMQMIPSTAARTARRIGLAVTPLQLTSDPQLNARLGAAHLGELDAELDGATILMFAAYNAGSHRVRQWIKAYGDPRHPAIDMVDWAERIPFSETRNYVQRVMENFQVYRALFGGGRAPLTIATDLEWSRAQTREAARTDALSPRTRTP